MTCCTATTLSIVNSFLGYQPCFRVPNSTGTKSSRLRVHIRVPDSLDLNCFVLDATKASTKTENEQKEHTQIFLLCTYTAQSGSFITLIDF